MEEAVVVSAVRSPVGRYGGMLRSVSASALVSHVIRAALERCRTMPDDVGEVIFGHVLTNGESPNVARLGWLEAGFPAEVPAYTVDRQCGSALQAIINAALLIQTGEHDVIVAGGVESESNAEFYSVDTRWGRRLGDSQLYDRITRSGRNVSCPTAFEVVPSMMHTSAKVANMYGITRREADEFALRSHQLALAAIDGNRFDDELVSIPIENGPEVSVDEGPRRDTSLESLARLPVLVEPIHTAGNSSSINDGAAACVLMSGTRAKREG